jgi:hypothetical protein
MNNEILQEQTQLLDKYLEEWKGNLTFRLREDFPNVVFDIRKNILESVQIPKIDMLTYKKAIIHQIQKEFENTRSYSFTDEELLENRIKNIPQAKDMKITKLLTKQITKERRYLNGDQRLDYFHKLPTETKEYFITGNPVTMARMYFDVDTCISPDGENQAAIFQYLLSPYFYLVYSSDFKNRMLVAINEDKKMITASRVYGGYDFMMSASFAKWCVDKGYIFAERYFYMLHTDGFQYIDSPDIGITQLVEYFGGDVYGEHKREFIVSAMQKPSHCTFVNDAITNEKMYSEDLITAEHIHSNCSHIMTANTEYCCECGELVDSYGYDEYESMCSSCASDHNYCEGCDEYHSQSDYDFDKNMCDYCVERMEEEEEEEDIE